MCGRFTQTKDAGVVSAQFMAQVPSPLSPRYNIAPSQQVLAVRIEPDGDQREAAFFRWGLIPSWAKDHTIGHKLINARSETAADKPSFRSAFRGRRCLIVADGFFEWQKTPHLGFANRKTPYYIRFNDHRLFGIAGLWDRWADHNGQTVESCAILTTTPNDLMAPIHNRMPVIINESDYHAWLNPAVSTPFPFISLLRPYPATDMVGIPISKLVNSPKMDDPRCLEPVEPPQS